MTHSGIEVKITHFSKGPTNFVLRGKLKTECKTLPQNLCWTTSGRYLLEGDHHLDLYVFREGEPFKRLYLPSEMNRLKLETRGERSKVFIAEVLPSHFPIRGYFEKDMEYNNKRCYSWTQSGRFFPSCDCPLDLMEIIEE